MTPTHEIKTCVEKKETSNESEIRAAPQIERLLIQLENDGRKAGTVLNYRKTFKRLLRGNADLFDPESAKAALARLPHTEGSKKCMAAILDVWFKFNNINWRPPKYADVHEIPYIPSEAELDQLVSALGKKMSAYCQILKETGARAGEASMLKWSSFDFETRQVRIKPQKGSNPRILPLSAKALDMLCNLPRKDDREEVFANADDMRSCFYMQRRRAAKKLGNPKLFQIHFHTFRHWKATTEQHKTKDPWHVKTILGHKSIKSTETYIHLEEMMYQDGSDQFTVKVAHSKEEAIKLLEVGYEYSGIEFDGFKLLRKRN